MIIIIATKGTLPDLLLLLLLLLLFPSSIPSSLFSGKCFLALPVSPRLTDQLLISSHLISAWIAISSKSLFHTHNLPFFCAPSRVITSVSASCRLPPVGRQPAKSARDQFRCMNSENNRVKNVSVHQHHPKQQHPASPAATNDDRWQHFFTLPRLTKANISKQSVVVARAGGVWLKIATIWNLITNLSWEMILDIIGNRDYSIVCTLINNKSTTTGPRMGVGN